MSTGYVNCVSLHFVSAARADSSHMVAKNVCGMSVVSKDFEKFKRFNLAELYDPTPKLEA